MSNNDEHSLAPPIAAVLLIGATGGALAAVLLLAPLVERAWLASVRPGDAPQRLVENVVVLLCAVVLGATMVWLAASTVVCLLDVRRTGTPMQERAGAFRPRFLRALLALTLSSLVATAGPGAGADRKPELPRALVGLTLPDLPYGGVRTHQVHHGESLWSITSDALPTQATVKAIGRAWPRLYRLNRARIGADPNLIQPGTTLRLPPAIPAPTRGVTR